MRGLGTGREPRELTRRFAVQRLVGKLDQNSVGGFRMQERDAASTSSGSRRFVDQPVPKFAAPREGSVEVGDTIADVVDAGPTLRQKFADRRVGNQRFKQLDVRVAEFKMYDSGAVYFFRSTHADVEHVAVKRHRVLDVRDCNSDVGN